MSEPTSDPGKRDLRVRALAARRALPPATRADQDLGVRATLTTLINERQASTVAAYVPMTGEPGGPELVKMLAEQVRRLLLPVLREDFDLDWAIYDGHLAPADRGLVEPDGPRLGVEAIAMADLVITPGLAVADNGVRLGRGGGSYDRALNRVAPAARIVTLLYRGERAARLPSEPHDCRVHGVITADGVEWLAIG